MKPFIIKNFYSKDLLDLLNFQVAQFKSDLGRSMGVEEERRIFFRKQVHSPALFKALHLLMTDRAHEFFGEKVKPSYAFVSMYDDERSICPLHTDRDPCKYTVDLCLNQKNPWGIFVNGEEYFLEKGDALIYSGTDHPHYRNLIEKDNFCDLAFFHFVPETFNGSLI